MAGCWQVVYASFPLHPVGDDKIMRDRALGKTVRQWQWDEAQVYNTDVPDFTLGSDSEDEADAGELPGAGLALGPG